MVCLWKQRLERCTLQMEEGTTSHAMGWLLEAGKDKETDSPHDPPEGTSLANTSSLTQ